MLTGKFTNVLATASSFEQAAQKLPQSWAPCHVPRLPSLMRSLFVNTRCDRHSLASRSAPRSAQLQMLAAPNLRGDSSVPAPSVCLQHRACVHAAADEHCRYHSPFFFFHGSNTFFNQVFAAGSEYHREHGLLQDQTHQASDFGGLVGNFL